MSVDQAETRRCDLSQEDRSRQVGGLNSGVIQPFAAPIIRDLGQLDDLDREPFRMGRYERSEAGDVELEDAVGVELVARLGCAGLKLRIARKAAGLLRWFGSRPVRALLRTAIPGHPQKVEPKLEPIASWKVEPMAFARKKLQENQWSG